MQRRDSKQSMDKFRRMSRVASLAFGMRRMSKFPTAGDRGSTNSSRLSVSNAPMIRLENSYRMEPHEDEKFNPEKASRVIQDVLSKFLKGEEYSAKCSEKTQRLSEAIRREMKDLGYNRYKLIVHALIGENKNQGIEVASRGLSLPEFDTWAQGSYKDSNIFGVVTVYAIYTE